MSIFESLNRNKKLLYYIIFLIPVILYFNTLFNDYALDDSIVITDNLFVKQGLAGIKDIFTTETFTGFFGKKKDLVQGGRYRPLSVATFAIEFAIWGFHPAASHLINIILYSLLCLILFKTLQRILFFFNKDQKSIPIAFLATLLFAVHPIHTEVVANSKGRDELLAVLFLLLSVLFFIKYIDKSSTKALLLTGILLFIALLSKENALTAIPIAIVLLILKYPEISIKRSLSGLLLLFIAAIIYIGIRFRVAGGFSGVDSNELMNNPFLHASVHQRSATIFYTLLLYLKLLIFPHPLTYDYYPYHINLQSWSNAWVIFSVSIHIILVLTGILNIRKNRILSFGILFYIITLLPVSNLVVNIGSFMNERFLFLPSVGYALLAGFLFFTLLSYHEKIWLRRIALYILSAILILFSTKTIIRNTQWKNNYTLFTHDVKISKNSAKGNCTAGGILLETAQSKTDPEEKKRLLLQSMNYLSKAIKIHPNYVDALLLLGNVHFEYDKNIPEVLIYYRKLFILAPGHELALNNLKSMLVTSQNADHRKLGYRYILSMYPDDFDANYQLGVTYGKMGGQLDSSKIYLKIALHEQPENKLVNRDLGVAYAMSGQYEESLSCFEKVIRLEPNDPDNYVNLGITYQKLGRFTDAKAMFEKAETLKKSKSN